MSILRQATRADIDAMSAIRLAVTENVLTDPARITRAMYEDYLDRLGRGWVVEHAGAPVAFCYADRRDGSIWALFVRPGHEGAGHATALLQHAVRWLFALGHPRAHLTTGAGTRADRFYAAQGWTRSTAGATDAAYTLPNPAHGSSCLPVTLVKP